MEEKYSAFTIAEEIGNNTNKAIDQAKPWFLRKIPKITIISAMVLLDGITTFASINMKFSVSPVLTIVLTIMFAFLLNIPQEQAAQYLKDYLKGKKHADIYIFAAIEVSFILMQLFLAWVKISVAPDLTSSSSSMLITSDTAGTGSDLLTYGMAGLLIVSSIASSVVCFALGMKDDDEKRKAEVTQKTRNKNYQLLIKMVGAKEEYQLIKADTLNLHDENNRIAEHAILEANTIKCKCLFRDELTKKLAPNGINDVSDEAQSIVNEYEKKETKS